MKRCLLFLVAFGLPVFFFNPTAWGLSAFRKNSNLFVIPDFQRGQAVWVDANVTQYKVGSVVAYLKGRSLHMVKDTSTGNSVWVANDVSSFDVESSTVVFNKNGRLFVVTDGLLGSTALIDERVTQFKVSDILVYLKNSSLYWADLKTGKSFWLAEGVNAFTLKGSAITFKKGWALYVVSDLLRGSATWVGDGITDFQ